MNKPGFKACGNRRCVVKGVDLEHLERIGEERLIKRTYKLQVDGNRGRGKPKGREVEGV